LKGYLIGVSQVISVAEKVVVVVFFFWGDFMPRRYARPFKIRLRERRVFVVFGRDFLLVNFWRTGFVS
jgi:hypothetical protein